MSVAWASGRPGRAPGPHDPSERQWGVVCLLRATSSPAQGHGTAPLLNTLLWG